MHDRVTGSGVSLFSSCQSLLAVIEPEFFVTGEESSLKSSNSWHLLFGGCEDATDCSIDYANGETIRTALIPASIMGSRSGQLALQDLAMIPGLYDVVIVSSNQQPLDPRWIDWLGNLPIKGLTLNGFSQLGQLTKHIFRKLWLLQLTNCVFDTGSIETICSSDEIRHLGLNGILPEGQTTLASLSLRAPLLYSLRLEVTGLRLDLENLRTNCPQLIYISIPQKELALLDRDKIRSDAVLMGTDTD